MFIYFMIFVFKYIDEIAGKGIDTWTLTKMLSYTFISILPLGLPIAVLLSSIMVFGNLGEQYELAALKSSGLSLFKITKPLFFFILFVSTFSFFFSNNIYPIINLKAKALLYDIRSTKPALNIKEGIFNNSIDGFSIKVGKKDDDGVTLHDIYIYDHTGNGPQGNNIQIYAKDGSLEMSPNKKVMTLKLQNGNRYQHVFSEARHQKTRPTIAMSFKEQIVKFDLSGFKMNKSDENNYHDVQFLNIAQIADEVDTVNVELKEEQSRFRSNFSTYRFPIALRSSIYSDSTNSAYTNTNDYLKNQGALAKNALIEKALGKLRDASTENDSYIDRSWNLQSDLIRLNIEWNKKFTYAFVCIVMFLVGAPLGAIVRKGGFGLPVVIAIVLFMIYYSTSFTCEKIAIEGKIPVVVGMWIGPLLFTPIGIWLTYKAAKDSALFDFGSYFGKFKNLFKKKEKAATV